MSKGISRQTNKPAEAERILIGPPRLGAVICDGCSAILPGSSLSLPAPNDGVESRAGRALPDTGLVDTPLALAVMQHDVDNLNL